MNFNQAQQIAECWVSVVSGGKSIIYREKTFALPYGWVFFYNSPEFIADPTNISASLVGNVPILIERINGELRVLSPRYQDSLEKIERELPPACLLMKPEQPQW